MSLPEMAILLFGIGIALLVGELLLPTHGLLGIAGAGAIAASVVTCYRIDVRLGTAVLVGTAVALPFAGAAAVKLWPKTPVGRRVVLAPPPIDAVDAPLVHIGQSGITVSELRPMGVCEFESGRSEAMAELGIIPPGRTVRVVNMSGNRPTVRAV